MGYGPANGNCPRTCGCPELCDAGESRAEAARDELTRPAAYAWEADEAAERYYNRSER